MSAAVRIDERLNLVVRVPRTQGALHVHTTPISHEVFEEHFLLIGKTFAFINTEGLGIVVGGRVAGMALKRIAMDMGIWEGPTGVQNTLVAELLRISNVAIPTPQGWQTVPLHNAIQQNHISAKEQSEVLNAIVFFIVNSAIHQQDMLLLTLTQYCDLWGMQLSQLSFTDYIASLPTLTADASSGGNATPAPIA